MARRSICKVPAQARNRHCPRQSIGGPATLAHTDTHTYIQRDSVSECEPAFFRRLPQANGTVKTFLAKARPVASSSGDSTGRRPGGGKRWPSFGVCSVQASSDEDTRGYSTSILILYDGAGDCCWGVAGVVILLLALLLVSIGVDLVLLGS